jgi:flagellar hook-associated protein 2
MSASIGGLASGLDTASIISQLMQLEAVQQNQLKSRVTQKQTAVSAMQSLNTKLAALAKSSTDLSAATGWSPVTASSSYDKVNVTTSTGALPTQLSLTVGSLAASHRLTFFSTAALGATVVSGGTTLSLDLLDGNGPISIETGDGSLASVVAAINTAAKGVRASTIKLDDGTYRLVVDSVTTGASGDFTLTNGDGTDLLGGATVRAGQDASITIGTDTIHSATNTFTNLLPGISVTLGTGAVAGTAVDIATTTDAKAMTDKVKSFVDSLNSILSDIDSATKGSVNGSKAGPLAGDSNLRTVRNALVSTLYSAGGGTLADYGVQLDRSGKFTFNAETFSTAYAADPQAVSQKFIDGTVPGFMARVGKVATNASDTATGSLTKALQGMDSTIKDLNQRITVWDQRLALRESTLKRQFTALETALSQMNSQSSWLAGQISSLSSG